MTLLIIYLIYIITSIISSYLLFPSLNIIYINLSINKTFKREYKYVYIFTLIFLQMRTRPCPNYYNIDIDHLEFP